MRKFAHIVFFFIFTCKPIYPQTQNINFEHISVEDGLSCSRITCFLQDQQGFLWIGTQDGLDKYDGYNFTIFRHNAEDTTSISSHRIWSILEDKEGIIWIGTLDGGLNRFDPEKQQFSNFMNNPDDTNSLSFNGVTSISEDNYGFLWIGTLRGGLNRFNKKTGKFTRFQHEPDNEKSLSHNSVLTTCIDKSNILWIGTWGGGINKFNRETEQFIHYKHNPKNKNSLSSNVIWSIFADRKNTLWIGTMDGGLNKFDRRKENFIHYKHNTQDFNSISQNSVNLIYEDFSGRLWIGTWGGGLDKFNPESEKFKNYHHNSDDPGSLSHNEVKSIYQDNSGIIWVGTNGGGLNKLDFQKEGFSHYRHIPNSNSLSNNDVWPIYCDKSGVIWIGTIGGGLNKFNPEKQLFTVYKHNPDNPNSLSHNSIISLLEDRNGMLWIGTINGGLNKFDRKNNIFTRYMFDSQNPQSLSHNFVPSLYEDKSGYLWIGTWGGGLCLYEKKTDTFKRYQHDPNDNNTINCNIIWSICEDRSGDIWIGTETGGLNKFDSEREDFKHYIHDSGNPQSISSNTIWCVYEDSRGTLWIGTAGAGLNKLNHQSDTFSKYTTEKGLPNNMINGIIEDDAGYLWISTNKGLSKFDPKKEKFRNYDTDDGLQNDQFSFNGVSKRQNGELLFGGINGFNIFHPDSIRDNQNIPQIVITNFQLFNKPVPIKESKYVGKNSSYFLPKHISKLEKIELSYRENVFSFEFAALDYHSPQKNKYAYKMEGVDPDWVYTDASRRFATYTNLDPGEYTFRVKGSNNDGIWNDEGTSINVIITPPWWKSNWAYTVYLFICGLFVFGVWRFQINRLKMKQQMEMEHFEAEKLREVDKLKSRFFANISHEFRTPLTLIKGPVKQMLDGKFTANLKEQYKLILRNSDRLLRLINQILDLSKLESGEMKLNVAETEIVQYVKELVFTFSPLAETKNVTLKFSPAEDVLTGYVDRDKLEKIIINLLSNAVKFTPKGGEVELALSLRGGLPSIGRATRQSEIKNKKEIASLTIFTRNDRTSNSRPKHKIASKSPIPNSDFVEICISNTGPGIPPDQIELVFDRFYQTDTTYKKDSRGSGIGLALTRELVDVCRGEITVTSIPGETTTFKVTLPIAQEYFKKDEIAEKRLLNGEEKQASRSLPSKLDSAEVLDADVESTNDGVEISSAKTEPCPLLLIVEDNPDVAGYISGFMNDAYRIVTAENGKEGLKKALDKYPDLIISDVMMPEMDGIQFCAKIKTDERTSHIPVILLTAKADMDSKLEGLEFGADDYITKPFEIREVRTRVENLIEQRRKLREKFSRIIEVNPGEITTSSQDEQFLKRLIDIFEAHVDDSKFSTKDFAREVGMSRSNLHRKLIALTNLPTHEFLRTLRLKRAAQLINQATGTVTEIAYAVGFENPSYFAKIFRQQFGQTPTEFANQNQLSDTAER